jgi:two-component system response regulator ChvI
MLRAEGRVPAQLGGLTSRRPLQANAGLERNVASSSRASLAVALAGVGRSDSIRVLLVEDDQTYREILSAQLSEQGFVVQSFGGRASLLDSLDAAADADVIILDWGLPGIDLLAQLRRRGVNLPVVFLTGRALPVHESLAFDKGAFDFISKGRGVEVLVRRLKRVVEAGKPAADPRIDKRIVCGKLVLRPGVSRAHWGEVDVDLTLGEFNIVHLLVSNVGHYVTYRAIYDRMHYEGFIAGSGHRGYRQNVRSAIKRIRNKFRGLDPAFDEIKNYQGFGYRWGRPEDAG